MWSFLNQDSTAGTVFTMDFRIEWMQTNSTALKQYALRAAE